MTKPATPFIHRFIPGRSARTLLFLHGTGGDENDLLPFGAQLDPEAAILSPRGQISENGNARFFRRLAEGVFDEADLIRRAHELADFIAQTAQQYAFDPQKMIAVGYSNGANIASAMLVLRPGTIQGAALWRAMTSLVPNELPDLAKMPLLIIAGEQDPIIPAENSRRLAALLERANAQVELEFEDAGHQLTARTLATTRRWLAAVL